MRKIAIILPGDKLPLPSVKGGAVESLVQCLLVIFLTLLKIHT